MSSASATGESADRPQCHRFGCARVVVRRPWDRRAVDGCGHEPVQCPVGGGPGLVAIRACHRAAAHRPGRRRRRPVRGRWPPSGPHRAERCRPLRRGGRRRGSGDRGVEPRHFGGLPHPRPRLHRPQPGRGRGAAALRVSPSLQRRVAVPARLQPDQPDRRWSPPPQRGPIPRPHLGRSAGRPGRDRSRGRGGRAPSPAGSRGGSNPGRPTGAGTRAGGGPRRPPCSSSSCTIPRSRSPR